MAERDRTVEYEPFPTGAYERQTAERRRRNAAGCAAGGGLGFLGLVLALVILGGILGSLAQGCDLSIDAGDPGKGTDSQRLPVTMSPTTGLLEGTEVTVTSSVFEANSIVGVAQCLREADTARKGVDACDEIQGARYAVDPEGKLHATVRVHREIRVGGKVFDCGERPQRCLLVAASAGDYDKSGGRTLTFSEGDEHDQAPPTSRAETDHLTIAAQPAGPVAGASELTVIATGFQPNEPVLVAWCTDAFEQEGPTACEATDETAALGAVMFRSMPTEPLADADGIVVATIEARRTIAPYAGTEGGGRHDCRTAPERCSIVIAAAADTKRSAVLPYTLTDE